MTDVVQPRALVSSGGVVVAVGCNRHGRESLFVHFISEDFLGEGRSIHRDLKYRIDGSAPSQVFTTYGDNTATVLNVGPSFNGASLLRGLATGQKLVLRFVDYRDAPHDAAIDISGGLASISRVAAACEDPDFEKVMAEAK